MIRAAHAALDRWGYGLSSVRFICGTQEVHRELESKLSAFLGTEARVIIIPRRTKDPLQLHGEAFLKHYALANLYFPVTTAYAILRHNGVELGKGDYLGIQPTDLAAS